jgi:hypothetical protein
MAGPPILFTEEHVVKQDAFRSRVRQTSPVWLLPVGLLLLLMVTPSAVIVMGALVAVVPVVLAALTALTPGEPAGMVTLTPG